MYKSLHQNTRHACRILMKLGFSNRLSKKAHILSFIKIRPVGAELFHADGRDKPNSRFSKFCERA